MRVERRDGSSERSIVIGMVVDNAVLGRIADKWTKEGLFGSQYANLIGGWCVSYYNRYSKAPGKSILRIFERWAEDNRDKETAAIVERFLESLSEEYETLASETNADLIIDLAADHFTKTSLLKLKDRIEGFIESGDLAKARAAVDKFSYVEVGAATGVDVLTDKNAIKQAFLNKSKPIIQYPGAAGNFFKDALERDAFIGINAPEKRGKTWWLLDIAWRAMQQGLKVAFFEVGDMSEGQILRRFMTRACKRPLKPTDPGKPVRYPISIDHVPDSEFAHVEHETFEYEDDLSWKFAWQTCQKIINKQKQCQLKLSVHPSMSITVGGMSSILQSWDRSGWGIPDVVVCDYADILAPPLPGGSDSQEQINTTWSQLRAMSQKLHCLVVTATQADADSYTATTMGMTNFSRDKRKLAHVTGMLGLNQTAAEKTQGLYRLNWMPLRESDYSPEDVCHVAGCLSIANPAILSIF